MDYVLDFQEIDHARVAVVGGKGAALGELSRIDGIDVPPGFCVTTDALGRISAGAPSIEDGLARLSRLEPEDGEAIRALSAEIRRAIEGIGVVFRQGSTSPCRIAYRVSSTRSCIPSFSRMFVRCRSTVFSLITSASAMSLVL